MWHCYKLKGKAKEEKQKHRKISWSFADGKETEPDNYWLVPWQFLEIKKLLFGVSLFKIEALFFSVIKKHKERGGERERGEMRFCLHS